MNSNSSRADQIVKDTFGTLLRSQGKGYYVALELLAIPSGCIKTAENQPCSATLSLAVPLENGDLWC